MNEEKIEGLWWKARIGYNNQAVDPEVLEKFAELIVRECAEWLKKPVNQTPLSGEIMNIAAERLKEHFGVEE